MVSDLTVRSDLLFFLTHSRRVSESFMVLGRHLKLIFLFKLFLGIEGRGIGETDQLFAN